MSNPIAPTPMRTRLLRHIATGKITAHDQLDVPSIMNQGGYQLAPDGTLVMVFDSHGGTSGRPAFPMDVRGAEQAIYTGQVTLVPNP